MKEILKTIQELQSQKEQMDSENVEVLAKCFDNIDPKIAKKIRKKGMPKVAYVGEEMFPLTQRYLSPYMRVFHSPLIDKDQVILSWVDFMNFSRPRPFSY